MEPNPGRTITADTSKAFGSPIKMEFPIVCTPHETPKIGALSEKTKEQGSYSLSKPNTIFFQLFKDDL